jgi:hypothetical protein
MTRAASNLIAGAEAGAVRLQSEGGEITAPISLDG